MHERDAKRTKGLRTAVRWPLRGERLGSGQPFRVFRGPNDPAHEMTPPSPTLPQLRRLAALVPLGFTHVTVSYVCGTREAFGTR